MSWQTREKWSLSLEVFARVCREDAKGVRAEEVVFGLLVDLAGDSEECEELHSVVESVGGGIEIDHGWRCSKYQVVYLISQFGGEGEEWEGFRLRGGVFIFGF